MNTDGYLEIILNEDKFNRFYEILISENEAVNITSVTQKKEVIYKHFFDSAMGESLIEKNSKVVEIGSGGGFPSVPLKIMREDLDFTLIESTGKKCRCLENTVEKLGLKCVKVLNIRAEEGAHTSLRESFDCAVARAVARLNTLCEYCLPYVRTGGIFIAYKGECKEELEEARRAIELLGGSTERVERYSLPEGTGERSLVVIRKIKPTPSLYPRGRGRERKNPL